MKKTPEEIMESELFKISSTTYIDMKLDDEGLFSSIIKAMQEYADQEAKEFVLWANKNSWYKHFDPNDDCWTSTELNCTLVNNDLYTKYKNETK